MREEPLKTLLAGTAEIDETYVGGKPRQKGTSKRGGGANKNLVLVPVEREGSARAMPNQDTTSKTVPGTALKNIAETPAVFTDKLASDDGFCKHFAGPHGQSLARTVRPD